MDELTKPESNPTTDQKLDLLITLLGELKAEVIALKSEFTGFAGRVEAVETKVESAQAAIEQVKKETQETPTVTETKKEDKSHGTE